MSDVTVSDDGKSSTLRYSPEPQSSDDVIEFAADKAIELMKNQPDPLGAAASLLMQWMRQDPGPYEPLMKRLLEDYVNAHVKGRAMERSTAK